MKKVNVLIAQRNREEYLKLCLRCLDLANQKQLYEVIVFVCQEGPLIWDEHFDNIDIHVILIDSNLKKPFRKGFLLNRGLERMEQWEPWDWFSIIDADMLYNPRFFSTMERDLERFDYVVSTGFKVGQEWTQRILADSKILNQLMPKNATPFSEGPSQVTMPRKTYELFQKIYGRPLYSDEFEGWGGEDSDLSFRSMDLEHYNLIKKMREPNMWYHLWHPGTKDPELYKVNLQTFERLRKENLKLIQKRI